MIDAWIYYTGLGVWGLAYAVGVLCVAHWVGYRAGKLGARWWLCRVLTGCNSHRTAEVERLAVKRLIELRQKSVAEFLYAKDRFDKDYRIQEAPDDTP